MMGRKGEMAESPGGKKRILWTELKGNYRLLILLIPSFALLVITKYMPMYGLVMAFEKYRVAKGYWGSQWVGLENFREFLSNPYALTLLKNTLVLGAESLLFGFPVPIIMALMFNEIHSLRLKKSLQTLSYLPYFVSTVIIIGIMKEMMSLDTGFLNVILKMLGQKQIEFFALPEWFRFIYIFSGIWQGAGFNSILYMAAIASIDTSMYESAIIDGASRFKRMLYITLPALKPTVVIMFIMAVGGLMGNDYTKILLIYNGQTYKTADVLQTYVYRLGIEGGDFSYSAAVGLLNSVISFLLLYGANSISKKMEGSSLW